MLRQSTVMKACAALALSFASAQAQEFTARQGTLDDYFLEIRCAALFSVGYSTGLDPALKNLDLIPFNEALSHMTKNRGKPPLFRDIAQIEADLRQAIVQEAAIYSDYFRAQIIEGTRSIFDTPVWVGDWEVCRQFAG
jgi:hypothetical protein